ncbi:GatB/YqeY domain-containing protein [Streptomyces sp. S6]
MSLRDQLRRALPEAMRAREKTAVSALRATLAALDNAEAVPVDASALRGQAIEQVPVGAGATEAERRVLGEEEDVVRIVRAEVEERLRAAEQVEGTAHAGRLRDEAEVLLRFLEPAAGHGSATP